MDQCCGKDLIWTKESTNQQDHAIEDSLCPDCKTVRKKKNKQNIYIKKGDFFVCQNCNSEILAADVLHPIHNGPFPLSGSGRVKTEIVPYCPQCEAVPSSSGTIITIRQQ